MVPTIIALQRTFEEVRKAELEKAVQMMTNLSEEDRKTLEVMTSVNREETPAQPRNAS